MQELTILQNDDVKLKELINQNKKRIFEFVRKNKETKVNLNNHLFLAKYKKKGQLNLPTIFLYRVIKEDEEILLTGVFSEYQIIKNGEVLKVL